jgi:putative DNA primase/helicase
MTIDANHILRTQGVAALRDVLDVSTPIVRLASSGLDIVCMKDVTPISIEYLWPNRLARGKAHILAGEGGRGKTTILNDWTARATTGSAWPDGAPGAEPGDVIVLASEDDIADTIAPRLIAAGANMSRVFVIRSVRDEQQQRRGFSLQADLQRLEMEIERLPNVVMVIFDPITSYLGPVDSHKNAEVRSVLDPVNDFAARTRVVVVANNHFSKGAGSANSRVIGSVAFVNAARAAFIVTPDESDETRMLLIPSKSNIGPLSTGLAYRIEGCLIEHDGRSIATSRVMYESAPVTISADRALAALQGGDSAKSARDEATDFLQDMLAHGPVPAKEVQRAASDAGISTKSLRTAREGLGIKPEKAGMKQGWVWQLRRCPNRSEDVPSQEGTSSGRQGHLRVVSDEDEA